jgi:hypothetical protein
MFKNVIFYCVKVWLTGVIVGPAAFLVIGQVQHYKLGFDFFYEFSDGFRVYWNLVCLQLVFSLITLLFFTIITGLTVKIFGTQLKVRFIIFFLAIILTASTFCCIPWGLIYFKHSSYLLAFVACDCCCIGAGVFIHRLEKHYQ